MTSPPAARRGDPGTFSRDTFRCDQGAHEVFRKGVGPAVIVIPEIPGLTPMVLGFADRLVDVGLSVVLPNLYGQPGRDVDAESGVRRAAAIARVLGQVCVSREFTLLTAGRESPVLPWLRALAAHEHARCGGPGVGAVGMCLTGGFALAMAIDARVVAPVLSQPSLPLGPGAARRGSIDTPPEAVRAVAGRCAAEGLKVLGLRFRDDPLVPAERFAYLREQLGDGFVAVELDQADAHPDERTRPHHSVLTGGLVDAPGEPTRAALDRVIEHLRGRLLG